MELDLNDASAGSFVVKVFDDQLMVYRQVSIKAWLEPLNVMNAEISFNRVTVAARGDAGTMIRMITATAPTSFRFRSSGISGYVGGGCFSPKKRFSVPHTAQPIQPKIPMNSNITTIAREM